MVPACPSFRDVWPRVCDAQHRVGLPEQDALAKLRFVRHYGMHGKTDGQHDVGMCGAGGRPSAAPLV